MSRRWSVALVFCMWSSSLVARVSAESLSESAPQLTPAPEEPELPCLSAELMAGSLQHDGKWTAFQRSNVVAPPLFWLAADRTFAMALLLYWHNAVPARGTNLHVLAPLFYSSCTPQRRTLASPLFAYRRDRDGAAGFLGPYFFRRDRAARTDAIFPFFLHSLDHGRRTLTLLNGYHHQSPTGSHSGVLPLVSWGHRADALYRAIPPLLVWHSRDPRQSLTLAGPYYRKHRLDGSWAAGLLPLYLGKRKADGGFYDVLPPLLFWRWGDRHEKHTLFATFHERQRSDGSWSATLFPLYFGARSKDEAHDVLFPLVWRYRGPHWRVGLVAQTYWSLALGERKFGSLPFYLGQRSDDGRAYDLAPPLLFARWRDHEQSSTLAGPFYRERRSDGTWWATLFPLYFGARKPHEGHDVLFPLFWRHSGPNWRSGLLAQSYWSRAPGEHKFGSLPFYLGKRAADGHAYDLLPPLLFARWRDREQTRTWALNTFYRRESNGDFELDIVPLLFARRRGSELRIVTPLGLRIADEASVTTVIGPAFHHHARGGISASGLVPLWFQGEHAGARYFAAPLALFSYRKREAQRSLLAGPFYLDIAAERWRAGLVPLYFAGRRGASYHDVVPPLLTARWGDAEQKSAWVLNTYFRRGPDHELALDIYPLMSLRKHHDRTQFVSPLVVHVSDRAAATTVVGPVYRHRAVGGSSHFGVLPLWLQSESPARRYYAAPLLLLGYGNQLGRKLLVVGPLYSRSERASRRFGLFPLYAGTRDGEHYRDVIFPLLTARWQSAQSHGWMAGPAYAVHRGTRHSRGLFPLYAEVQDARQQFQMLTPFFLRWGSDTTRTTAVLPFMLHRQTELTRRFVSPLVFTYENEQTQVQRTTVLPLYWRRRSPSKTVDVLAPFWWRFDRRDAATRVTALFPLGFRYRSATQQTTVALNTAFTRGRGKDAGAWSFNLFPLLSLSRFSPSHFKWQVFTGLLGREHDGARSRWRALWMWTEPT